MFPAKEQKDSGNLKNKKHSPSFSSERHRKKTGSVLFRKQRGQLIKWPPFPFWGAVSDGLWTYHPWNECSCSAIRAFRC